MLQYFRGDCVDLEGTINILLGMRLRSEQLAQTKKKVKKVKP